MAQALFLYSYFESLGFFLINPFFHLHSFNVQDNTLILISVSRLENTLSVFVCFPLFNIRVEISHQHFYCSSKWRHDIKPLHSFFENNTVHLLGMFSVIRGINKEIKGESLQKYRWVYSHYSILQNAKSYFSQKLKTLWLHFGELTREP